MNHSLLACGQLLIKLHSPILTNLKCVFPYPQSLKPGDQIKLLVQPKLFQSVSHLLAEIVFLKLECKKNDQLQLFALLNFLTFNDLKDASAETGLVVFLAQADKVLLNLVHFVQIAFSHLGAYFLEQLEMFKHVALTRFKFGASLNKFNISLIELN